MPRIIQEPPVSGKISFGNFLEDLKLAYAGEVARNGSASDPWRAMARKALELAPITLPEE